MQTPSVLKLIPAASGAALAPTRVPPGCKECWCQPELGVFLLLCTLCPDFHHQCPKETPREPRGNLKGGPHLRSPRGRPWQGRQ